jgi:hypothetical protein
MEHAAATASLKRSRFTMFLLFKCDVGLTNGRKEKGGADSSAGRLFVKLCEIEM